ncbi:hypothetical protein Zmor_005575 [Zophobas morio]|uniref:Uncharacterized protein n=1 Tax=Zophobas morio TaxID=2755281 RepID=A0AA38IS94_9CUCU|nr:hypothetical protein Zmor_005575 [Zophobas morio]
MSSLANLTPTCLKSQYLQLEYFARRPDHTLDGQLALLEIAIDKQQAAAACNEGLICDILWSKRASSIKYLERLYGSSLTAPSL